MSSTNMTGAEQARFTPPPCPKCGGTDVAVHWQDCTSSRDDERHFAPAMFECRTCQQKAREEAQAVWDARP